MKSSIWRHAEASERQVKNVDARASAAQVRLLIELDGRLDRQEAYSIYGRMTGTPYMQRRLPDRYKALDRLTASDLIAAYKVSA